MLPGTETRTLAPAKQPYLAQTAYLVWGRRLSSPITLPNNTKCFSLPAKMYLHLPTPSLDVSIPCISRTAYFHAEESLLGWTLGMDTVQWQGNGITSAKG